MDLTSSTVAEIIVLYTGSTATGACIYNIQELSSTVAFYADFPVYLGKNFQFVYQFCFLVMSSTHRFVNQSHFVVSVISQI